MTILIQRCGLCLNQPNGCDGSCRRTSTGMPPNYAGDGPVFVPMLLPKGCICPPGSEATCQRGDCGRKGYKVSGAV
jgi:hypothetical protein